MREFRVNARLPWTSQRFDTRKDGIAKAVRGLVEHGGKWGHDFVHGGKRYTAGVGTKQEAQAALDAKRGSLQNERLAKAFGVKRGRGRMPTVQEFHDSQYRPHLDSGDWFTGWDAARRACKLKGLRPHDLSHSVGQRLEDDGVGEATIAELLGRAPRGTAAG